jgi:hypothetical protein
LTDVSSNEYTGSSPSHGRSSADDISVLISTELDMLSLLSMETLTDDSLPILDTPRFQTCSLSMLAELVHLSPKLLVDTLDV